MSVGFKKVTGIDLDDEGLALATKNCEQTHTRFPFTEFELIKCDASMYSIPDSMTVIFFFNPFGPQTMKQVVGNILESLVRAPRKIWVIYQNPVNENIFIQSGFKMIWCIQSKNYVDISLLVIGESK